MESLSGVLRKGLKKIKPKNCHGRRSYFTDLYDADGDSVFGCCSVLSFVENCGKRYKDRRSVSVKGWQTVCTCEE